MYDYYSNKVFLLQQQQQQIRVIVFVFLFVLLLSVQVQQIVVVVEASFHGNPKIVSFFGDGYYFYHKKNTKYVFHSSRLSLSWWGKNKQQQQQQHLLFLRRNRQRIFSSSSSLLSVQKIRVGQLQQLNFSSSLSSDCGVVVHDEDTTTSTTNPSMITTTTDNNNTGNTKNNNSNINSIDICMMTDSTKTTTTENTILHDAVQYYQQHNGTTIPLPSVMHMTLQPPMVDVIESGCTNSTTNNSTTNSNVRRRVLVIGDIHGCYDELLLLYEKACYQVSLLRTTTDDENYTKTATSTTETTESRRMIFDYVISVGDLVNKGPQSVACIQHFRTTPNWYAVRGNHDEHAMKHALSAVVVVEEASSTTTSVITNDNESLSSSSGVTTTTNISNNSEVVIDTTDNNTNFQKTVQQQQEQQQPSLLPERYNYVRELTKDDIQWMLELPYSIRLPGTMFFRDNRCLNTTNTTTTVVTNDVVDPKSGHNDDEDNTIIDTVIVHAGVVPGIELHDQTITTLTTIRDVIQTKLDGPYSMSMNHKKNKNTKNLTENINLTTPPPPTTPTQTTTTTTAILPNSVDPIEDTTSPEETTFVGQHPSPWASHWTGPYRILFGHDAKRELQWYPRSTTSTTTTTTTTTTECTNPDDDYTPTNTSSLCNHQQKPYYDNNPQIDCQDGEEDDDNEFVWVKDFWTMGLDTGCCYGKVLTGIILPERILVQVNAKEIYSPI